MKIKVAITAMAVLALGLSFVSLSGCNRLAKKYGGTITEELKPGQKLENVSWKGDDLWVLTRDMRPGETPEVYRYHEISNLGVIEGTVILKEKSK